jgi:hypothetical protein
MKAKISKLNNLLLERERGEFISQICFGGDNCGLRCPLFRIYNDPINGNPKRMIQLMVIQRVNAYIFVMK